MRKKKNIALNFEHEDEVIQFANSKNLNEMGISNREEAIAENGDNKLIVKKFQYFKKYFEALTGPFSLLLWVISAIEIMLYIFIKDKDDGSRDILNLVSALMVFVMIFLAATMDFVQELKAYKANIKLHQIITNDFYVINKKITFDKNVTYANIKNMLVKINESKLTKGDLIYLAKGDVVPADCKIFWIDEKVYANQETLTGESRPIKKSLINKEKELLKLNNILFAETTVVEGSCLALVVNTGIKKYSSLITQLSEDNSESKFEESMQKITKQIVISVLAMIPIILIISGFRQGSWVSAVIFSLSIAVALIPEALPAIIAYNLKVGVKRLSKHKVVVKKMSVVQNMGSLDILTTDKTGTLTTGEFEYLKTVSIDKNISEKYLEQLIYINSVNQISLTNKVDEAILNKLKFNNLNYEIISEQQFEHETRISSFLINYNDQTIQITKGAFKQVIDKCNLSKKEIKKLEAQNQEFIDSGYKVMAIAIGAGSELDACDLKISGFILMIDQLKDSIIKIIKTFEEFKIDLKILTGDNLQNSEAVAKQIQLNSISHLSGQQLSDEKNLELVDAINIFYEMSPLDKAKIVETYQSHGHTVGFLGDGINDVVALKRADVGISVNNATPLAKASADIILLEKDLSVLEESFVKGREIFTNAIKYIKITVASNFGIMFTLFLGAVVFNFQVMSPIQLLTQNLIFDFANLVYVFDKIDEIEVKEPKKWKTNTIVKFGLFNAIPQVIISFINFAVLIYGFNLDPSGNNTDQDLFQTAYFIEAVLTHIMIIFVYRTSMVSFVQSQPSLILTGGLLVFATVPFILSISLHGIEGIGFASMLEGKQAWWYLVLIGLLILGWVLSELSKFTYKKIFKDWL